MSLLRREEGDFFGCHLCALSTAVGTMPFDLAFEHNRSGNQSLVPEVAVLHTRVESSICAGRSLEVKAACSMAVER